MAEIYLHIVARMADCMAAHPYGTSHWTVGLPLGRVPVAGALWPRVAIAPDTTTAYIHGTSEQRKRQEDRERQPSTLTRYGCVCIQSVMLASKMYVIISHACVVSTSPIIYMPKDRSDSLFAEAVAPVQNGPEAKAGACSFSEKPVSGEALGNRTVLRARPIILPRNM